MAMQNLHMHTLTRIVLPATSPVCWVYVLACYSSDCLFYILEPTKTSHILWTALLMASMDKPYI